jgi:aspartate racemase
MIGVLGGMSWESSAEWYRLANETVRRRLRERYREFIGSLIASGAQGIILGCTEIEMLVCADDAPVPVFPTTALHVDAAIAFALREA